MMVAIIRSLLFNYLLVFIVGILYIIFIVDISDFVVVEIV
jgi:hypothetical protein